MTRIVLDGNGQDMTKADLAGLFNYDKHSVQPTIMRYFDDIFHYAAFVGTGFTAGTDGVPTAGVVNEVAIVIAGFPVQTYSGLSIGAVELYNLALANDLDGLYAIILAGNDSILGTSSSDRLIGGTGNDIIRGLGGIDRILGEDGDDRLMGDNGADILTGAKGNDRFDGGRNADTMTGGPGADRFYFTTDPVNNRDRINDFKEGIDKIILENSVFAGIGTAGARMDESHFLSVSTLAGAPDDDVNDRIIYATTTGILYYDAAGSTAAVEVVRILNEAPVTASDIWLV
jgi:Ca2+-binding RTX toxin-like protein